MNTKTHMADLYPRWTHWNFCYMPFETKAVVLRKPLFNGIISFDQQCIIKQTFGLFVKYLNHGWLEAWNKGYSSIYRILAIGGMLRSNVEWKYPAVISFLWRRFNTSRFNLFAFRQRVGSLPSCGFLVHISPAHSRWHHFSFLLSQTTIAPPDPPAPLWAANQRVTCLQVDSFLILIPCFELISVQQCNCPIHLTHHLTNFK